MNLASQNDGKSSVYVNNNINYLVENSFTPFTISNADVIMCLKW